MTTQDAALTGSGAHDGPARRLLLSLALVVATGLVGSIPLPGVTALEVLGLDRWAGLPNLSVGAMGVGPIVTGFIFAEFAALVVPRWRHLRSAEGRAKLKRAAAVTSVFMAALRGLAIAIYLEGSDWIYESAGWLPRIVVMASMAAFTCLELVALAANERFGLGSGLSFFMIASSVGSGGVAVWTMDPAYRPEILAHVAPVMAVVVVATLAVLKSPLAPPDQKASAAVAVAPFASGLAPMAMTHSLTYLVVASGSLSVLLMKSVNFIDVPRGAAAADAKLALTLTLVVLATAGFAALFHPVEQVAHLFAQVARATEAGDGAPNEEAAENAARTALRTATGRVILFLLALNGMAFAITLGLGEEACAKLADAQLDLGRWVMVVAVALDLAAEWRARTRHDDWVAVAVEHHVWAARILVWSLERLHIDVLARGIEARSCYHFFGPYIPIEIMIRSKDRDRATSALAALSGCDADRTGQEHEHHDG